ncbi:hypothetical protein MKW92_009101 [Papaver armeniacum]|nr:hypothetical protein MKW92_009101 [Papaver armeniacum]
MGSSVRVFGSVLHKFSNGVSSKCPILSFSLQRTCLLGNYLTSSSSSTWVSSSELKPKQHSARKIMTFSPVCMGRRSSKIAGRKGAQDAKKAKRYGKIGKEIDQRKVKKGGPNPVSNTLLATILEKAKELDVPKDILERNIKRASEKGQEAYIERLYEVYGYGGVGMVVEVLTDNVNRSVAAVRTVVKDCGGKMADSGSIMFKFRRARVANVKVTDAEKDQILTGCIRFRYYKIICPAENYTDIVSKLREEGIALMYTILQVDDEAMDLNKDLMSKLLELDDVDAVYADQQ